ncbi:MAG: hypothetical protein JW856_01645 [Dehalococcoidales bacterium]|nr:hypothetical protein [Dehalococcoidales bacterium]
MTLIQRLLMTILPDRLAKSMEEESRAWLMQCPCGYEISVWEAGGIRYKAAGKSMRLRHCPTCGHMTWHRLHKTK